MLKWVMASPVIVDIHSLALRWPSLAGAPGLEVTRVGKPDVRRIRVYLSEEDGRLAIGLVIH